MKRENVTYYEAEGENLIIFCSSLAAMTAEGKKIVANFHGKTLVIFGQKTQYEIILMFDTN